MSDLSEADNRVLQSLKDLFARCKLLDGEGGDFGGVLVPSNAPWHITYSLIARCYVFSTWVKTAPRDAALSTPEMQSQWHELLQKTDAIVSGAGRLSARLHRELTTASIASSSDWDAVGKCGLAVAIAGAACGTVATGAGMLACLAGALTAWNYCDQVGRDHGDDRGGRDDRDRRD
jgi:hypothetical protein